MPVTERSPLLANNDGGRRLEGSGHDVVVSPSGRSTRFRSVGARERRLVLSFGSSRSIQCSSLTTNLFLTITAIIAGAADVIYLPVLTGSFVKHISCGHFRQISSTFFIQVYSCFWLTTIQGSILLIASVVVKNFNHTTSLSQRFRCFMGLFASLSFFMSTYASLPNRTPPSLQAVFYMTLIPLIILCRWISLRKTVSAPRLICAFAVMVGMFIVLEPTIFKIDEKDEGETSGSVSTSSRTLWILMFALSFIPLAVFNVSLEYVFEKNITGDEKMVHPLVMAFWLQLWSTFFMIAFSFTDFIPHFGQAASFGDFITSIREGFSCMFGSAPSPGNCTAQLAPDTTPLPGLLNPDPHCLVPIQRFWIFIGIFLADNFMVLMVIKYSDGAIYSALVSSLKAPLATIFWRLFKRNKYSNIEWNPVFDEKTVYVLVGLCFIIPAAGLYNYLTFKEEEAVAPKPEEDSNESCVPLQDPELSSDSEQADCISICKGL